MWKQKVKIFTIQLEEKLKFNLHLIEDKYWKMPARRGLLAPQNNFLETIATRFDGTRKYIIVWLFIILFYFVYFI